MAQCGIQCLGLGDEVGIGHRLELVILKVFSNLDDFIIVSWWFGIGVIWAVYCQLSTRSLAGIGCGFFSVIYF